MLATSKALVHTVYPYQYSSLRRLLEPRRFQAYCLGTNKSGTHSIASLFAKHYKATHEEAHGSLINGFLDWQAGELNANEFQTMLLKHNKYAWLEMDSSHVHIEYVELLVKLFPQAKFILTIRDCYSWLDSYLNHSLNYPLYQAWARLHNWRYGRSDFSYSAAESPLREAGFYPLENYFAAWTAHNQRALDTIPPEQLLVLRTFDIAKSIDCIADFLKIPANTLDTQRSHSFQAPKRHYLLAQIDSDCIREKAEKHCGELMTKFFDDQDYLELLLSKAPNLPEIQS